MPMPAAKSMADQLAVEYSGFSPSRPSGISPYRENARTSRNTTNPMASRTNSQPAWTITQSRAALETASTASGCSTPHTTKPTTSRPTTARITRSTP